MRRKEKVGKGEEKRKGSNSEEGTGEIVRVLNSYTHNEQLLPVTTSFLVQTITLERRLSVTNLSSENHLTPY